MDYGRTELTKIWESDFKEIALSWCVVYMSQNCRKYHKMENHWKSELKTHIKNAIQRKIKNNNSASNRIKVLRSAILYDGINLNRYDVIDSVIHDKFATLNIKTHSKVYRSCLAAFSRELIDLFLLVVACDTKEIEKYVEDLYLTENE
jgi:hypothetical protein